LQTKYFLYTIRCERSARNNYIVVLFAGNSLVSHLTSELKVVADNLRDFLFTAGYKLTKVLDPAVSWRGKEKEELWGEDPVQPKEEAYKWMAHHHHQHGERGKKSGSYQQH
jgi:hypothetical protein